MADTCRSCNAPILWAITPKGRRMPLDPEPTPEGNLRLTPIPDRTPLVGKPLTGEDLEAAQASGEPLHTSHFATCPDARQHRHRG